MTADTRQLAAGVIDGDRRAIARAISHVEAEGESAASLVRALHPRTGRGYLVGVTGAPGVGKSTLVDRLARTLRARDRTVGVLAVDPSSPFSGGAVLGDRVRMQTHAGDDGVFVRSMASRGQLGGLSRATGDAALVLDAAGFDVIVIETVGVGQAEVEISRAADVTLVVTMPGGGDGVQTLKAGVMEIADLFVVNKADHAGADRAVAEIEAMLHLNDHPAGGWQPPVVRTRATEGRGIEEVVEAVDRFRARGGDGAEQRRRARVRTRVRQLVSQRFLDHAEHRALEPGAFDRLVDEVAGAVLDPYTAADRILDLAARGGTPRCTERGEAPA
jgi:LAO/AO transport system kinase